MPKCKELSNDELLPLCRKYGVPEEFISALQTTQDLAERKLLCESIGKYFMLAISSFRVDSKDTIDVKIAARIEDEEDKNKATDKNEAANEE